MNLLDPNCGMDPALRRFILLHTDIGRAVIMAEDAQFAAGEKGPLITGKHGGHYRLLPGGKEYEKVGGPAPAVPAPAPEVERQRLADEHDYHQTRQEFNEVRADHHHVKAGMVEGQAEALRDGAGLEERNGNKQKAQQLREQANSYDRQARQHRSYERNHSSAAREAGERATAAAGALAAHDAAQTAAPADWGKITGSGGKDQGGSPVNWADVAAASSQHVMEVIRRLATRKGA